MPAELTAYHTSAFVNYSHKIKKIPFLVKVKRNLIKWWSNRSYRADDIPSVIPWPWLRKLFDTDSHAGESKRPIAERTPNSWVAERPIDNFFYRNGTRNRQVSLFGAE